MKHIGYIIANVREEFLHTYEYINGIETRGWSRRNWQDSQCSR